jgi:Family of unknown function (DUF6232)
MSRPDEANAIGAVFYLPKRGVSVTEFWFRAGGYRFKIEDVSRLETGRGSIQASRHLALRVILVEGLVLAGLAFGARSVIGWVVAAIGVVIMTATAWLSAWRWPTPWLLWAQYRGHRILIYMSTDQIEFNKVRRALGRAMERHDLRQQLVA